MNKKWEIAIELAQAFAGVALIVAMIAVAAAAPGFFVILAANTVFPALAIPVGFWSSVAATFLMLLTAWIL